jgi:hypothetical protein
MKNIITIIAIVVFGAVTIGVVLHLAKPAVVITEVSTTAQAEYENSAVGLAFSYTAGPTGYVLEERIPADNVPSLLTTITLTPAEEHARFVENPPIGGEGPAVIAINVFKNDDNRFPLDWAMQYPEYSSYNLKLGLDEEMVVGGANALEYNADGLYPARQVIVAHDAFMYVLTGQYPDLESQLREDFTELVSTLQFIPQAASVNEKIDVATVCESALMYMTFPDGASADAFVAECINGEHPEVIERYKQETSMTGAML